MNTGPGRPPNEPRTRLGEMVREARTALGLTQAAFADLIGAPNKDVIAMTESTRDVSQVYPAMLERLAALDSIDRDELFAAAERVPPEILDALTGDVTALRKVRKELGL